MKRNFTFLAFFFFAISAFSQQEAQFSHNMFNHMATNPGFAGLNQAICAKLIARQQWMGFSDEKNNKVSPQTILFSIDGNVNPLRGGLGLSIYKDKLGFEDNIGVKLGYAYHLNLGAGKLGIGLQVGLLNKSIDYSKFIAIDQDDPLLQNPTLQKTMIIDYGFGLFYKIPNKLYAGLSSDQLAQTQSNFFPSASPKLRRHYYLTGGYYYQLPNNPEWELNPSIFVKSDLTSTQFDINALVKYNNKFYGGLSYRATDAVVVLLGMYFKDFVFGYSYDITTSSLGSNGRSSGSHEIMVGYCFKITVDKKQSSYKNTRFFN
jgi:type IX secretion system PorP/SprF family membrane protein